jgi:hypothetical protein
MMKFWPEPTSYGRQTPGSTRGSPPFIQQMWGVNPELNPGFGVLRCGSMQELVLVSRSLDKKGEKMMPPFA